jgi:hypothetical protein
MSSDAGPRRGAVPMARRRFRSAWSATAGSSTGAFPPLNGGSRSPQGFAGPQIRPARWAPARHRPWDRRRNCPERRNLDGARARPGRLCSRPGATQSLPCTHNGPALAVLVTGPHPFGNHLDDPRAGRRPPTARRHCGLPDERGGRALAWPVRCCLEMTSAVLVTVRSLLSSCTFEEGVEMVVSLHQSRTGWRSQHVAMGRRLG